MPLNTQQRGKIRVVLASASSRRRKILDSLGVPFEVAVSEVEEVTYLDDARRTASENALRKCEWCSAKYPGGLVIAADTVIDFKGRVVGKPATMDDAFECLRQFSGERHTVITAVAISMPGSDPVVEAVESVVVFRQLTDEQIREYCALVNPMDKAGAYDIDQRGDSIIESFTGSRTNIMGLPAEVIAKWL